MGRNTEMKGTVVADFFPIFINNKINNQQKQQCQQDQQFQLEQLNNKDNNHTGG